MLVYIIQTSFETRKVKYGTTNQANPRRKGGEMIPRPLFHITEAEYLASLAIIQLAANDGDREAQAWLRGEGYIHITDYPHESIFVRFDNQFERHTPQARKWTKDVYRRDNFTCQDCGERGGRLNAHHIKEWAKYPELRYEADNGITLCEDCHASKHPHLLKV